MAGQRPFKPPPRPEALKPYKAATPYDIEPPPPRRRPMPNQGPAERPNTTSTRPTGQGNLQKILAYFDSQGVADDHVVATIAGMPLKLNELKSHAPSGTQAGQPHQPGKSEDAPGHNKPEERKRPSSPKAEEDGS